MAQILIGLFGTILFITPFLITFLWVVGLGGSVILLQGYFLLWFLILLIYLSIKKLLPYKISYLIGFYSLLIAAVFSILNLLSLSEFIMRISILFWLVGIIREVIAYFNLSNPSKILKSKNEE